ncbi:hypothetical protein HanRHA438_Chr16g0753781 [Helianthus annuus]|nr:hypothetical protein HanIR_Chr16g0806481 [Helianthus annuus]KAJ0835310.1 hypothetical protein HanRHA438_Chr16g0753781 [Helianthus annuus]
MVDHRTHPAHIEVEVHRMGNTDTLMAEPCRDNFPRMVVGQGGTAVGVHHTEEHSRDPAHDSAVP